jgi:hypothetical protein
MPVGILMNLFLSLQQILYVVSTHLDTTVSSSSHKKYLLFQKFLVLLGSFVEFNRL